jgi:hypothetical protein
LLHVSVPLADYAITLTSCATINRAEVTTINLIKADPQTLTATPCVNTVNTDNNGLPTVGLDH